jgi:hypothetical protein
MYNVYRDEMIKRTGKKNVELKIQRDEKEADEKKSKEAQLAPVRSKWTDYGKRNIHYEFSHPGLWVYFVYFSVSLR